MHVGMEHNYLAKYREIVWHCCNLHNAVKFQEGQGS